MIKNIIKLYHVSNPAFRTNINKEGLISQIGPSYQAHYENISNEPLEPRLFVTTKNNYNSTYNDDRYLIVLTNVEYEALDFKIDKEAKDSLYTKKNPFQLIVLYLFTKEMGKIMIGISDLISVTI